MTGSELYEISLDLCGLRKSDGTVPSDLDDLTQRALSMINLLIAETSSLDAKVSGEIPTVKKIDSLSDTVPESDIVVGSVLPYGLARLLMLNEDEAFADRMLFMYEQKKKEALSFGKAKKEEIQEVYS